MNRYGNPSTPGPGLRTLVRAEQARKAAAVKAEAKDKSRKAIAAMAKGVR